MTDVMIAKARSFAIAAHCAIDQRRKHSGEAYWRHPEAVVAIVAGVPHSSEMLAAAWMHDVVEDTKVTLDVIRDEFGDDVANLVAALTHQTLAAGNRATRKAADRARLAAAPAAAQTIKLADLIDNTKSIAAHDPDFWVLFRAEQLALLEVLEKGDRSLWQRAFDQRQAYPGTAQRTKKA